MVGVEHGAGVGQVEVVVGALAPRQLEDGVEPGADPAVLGLCGGDALEPVDLALDGAHVLGQPSSSASRCGSLGDRRPPSSSPSSLRMASSCWRSRNSAAGFSMPSVTSVRILLGELELGEGLLDPAEHLLEPLGSTSTVSSSSTLRSSERSGHQPAVSARAPGSSRPRSTSPGGGRRGARAPRRRWPAARAPARGPARSARRSSTGSAWSHSASVVPTTPVPSRARLIGPDHEGRGAAGRCRSIRCGRSRRPGVAPSMLGTRRRRPSSPAAAVAAFASSVSRARVRPSAGARRRRQGQNGRVRVCYVSQR